MLLALLVAACAAPKIEYTPFEVRVEVPVPCAAERPPAPDWAFDARKLPPATSDNFDKHVDALTAERKQRMAYEKKLEAATEGCR